jgi:hypothetical protein
MAVGGDSSGGNLAAAVTLLARDRGGPAFVHQLLVYPNTDHQACTDSMRDMTDRHFFNPTAVEWYWGLYLASPEDGASPLASPLRAADLSGLPPATVITAEYDPLRRHAARFLHHDRRAGHGEERGGRLRGPPPRGVRMTAPGPEISGREDMMASQAHDRARPPGRTERTGCTRSTAPQAPIS